MKREGIALAGALMLLLGNAQATLHDRGGGLLYDDVLKITWLQDANYAQTSGYSFDGTMNWAAGKAWADGLVYAGYSDWRLATNSPVNGTLAGWNYNASNNGSTDWGFNITSTHSEMSYMYYVNLGLKGYKSPSGAAQSDYGIFGNGTTGGQKNVGPVHNLQSGAYWSEARGVPGSDFLAWNFYMTIGEQGQKISSYGTSYSWAVRAGDVPAIPEPESYALMLIGIGMVGFATRRRRSTNA